MRVRLPPAAAGWMLAAAGFGAAAQAPAPSPASSPAAVARLAACTACHGAGGQSSTALTPSLGGQPRLFIENQLVLIREGLRDVPVMQPLLTGVSDEEIVQLATHFVAQPAMRGEQKNDPALALAGAALARARLCGTCHLADYRGQQQVPRLAGQRLDYLVASMQEFRDKPGPGRDTIMAATLRGLSDAELTQLAHYLTALP